MSKVVGVIGGMGPEATVEFLRRIVAETKADKDQDHIRILVDNNPKIPSRYAHLIERTGADPTPVLIEMARGLERQGADFLVVPCNTAHHYLPQIAEAVHIDVLDMVALAIKKLSGRRIGMLAMPAVRKVGLYTQRLNEAGYEAVFPQAEDEMRLQSVIDAVKRAGVTNGHRDSYADVAAALKADAYLIACTELSVLGPPDGIAKPTVDALDALVAETIKQAI